MEFKHHSSLGSDDIRLLEPVSIGQDTLIFNVSTFKRKYAPAYTAASYAWGDGDASEEIYLNGQVFPVRLNLWSCLYYLGTANEHGRWQYIWADAICIDQRNTTEKDAQVSTMDETYKQAACVSIWLGLARLPEDVYVDQPSRVKTVDVSGLDWQESLADLANRLYWSRYWVIQEFLLGQDVEICCSNHKINWSYFKEELCLEAGVLEFDVEYDGQSNGQLETFGALPLVMGRHMDKHPQFYQTLYDMLVNYRGSKCKDPRDRVFSLLGLVHPEERGFLARVFPDYKMTEEHVHVVTLAHLTQYPSERGRMDITVDSVELFSALGVQTEKRKKLLLRRAKDLDYLDANLKDQLLAMHWTRQDSKCMFSNSRYSPWTGLLA